jgi:cytosine/adenosine deaminase-related metal-dependent hydrolase
MFIIIRNADHHLKIIANRGVFVALCGFLAMNMGLKIYDKEKPNAPRRILPQEI